MGKKVKQDHFKPIKLVKKVNELNVKIPVADFSGDEEAFQAYRDSSYEVNYDELDFVDDHEEEEEYYEVKAVTPPGSPFRSRPKSPVAAYPIRRKKSIAKTNIPKKDHLKCVERPSVLSTDSQKVYKYDGFFNLGVLLLAVSNFRILFDNAKKYGLLWNLYGYFIEYLSFSNSWIMLWTVCSYAVWIFLTFLMEKWIASYYDIEKKKKPTSSMEWLIFASQILCCYFFIHLTIQVIFLFQEIHPASGIVAMAILVVLFMKLYSYIDTNKTLRKDYSSQNVYPKNITFLDMCYFICAPTLVYEDNYPRTEKIRWSVLAKLCAQFFLFALLMEMMVEQFMLPIAENQKYHDLEKLLKMAIPNITIWLIMFYTVFHLGLNILAEILRFGDRLFYLDWWNCTSMDFFWRTWNLPVHKWMVVHVYIPLLQKGVPASFASFMVFFVSAVGHEVIISIPFRTWKFWAFSAMMAQMPLCLWTRIYTKGHWYGNVLFWSSFMFGQANCILMYFRDFQSKQ